MVAILEVRAVVEFKELQVQTLIGVVQEAASLVQKLNLIRGILGMKRMGQLLCSITVSKFSILIKRRIQRGNSCHQCRFKSSRRPLGMKWFDINLTWGHAIVVSDSILKYDTLLSPLTPEIGEIGGHAARMSTPGAAIWSLRMFGVILFGPLDENGAM